MSHSKFAALTHSSLVLIMFSLLAFAGLARPVFAQSPAAFVYVSNNPSGNQLQLNGYAVASNGQLTPIPGSPFSANASAIAVEGKYLFGTDGVYIYSYSIASNGALTLASSINAQQLNGGSGGPAALFLDHTGATLYDFDYDGNEGANNDYQSFSVNQSTGQLTYLGASQASEYFQSVLSFIGNNEYAYSSSCYHFTPDINGFQRESNQTLNLLSISPAIPSAPTGSFYCPFQASADPNNNLAIAMQPLDSQSWQPDGPAQLAVYTADASGNLTTNSTASNMPTTLVQTLTDYWMSPAGNLLAVAGTGGAQVFHFNGSNPITHYTGLLTKEEIDQVLWDNNNHLYGISGPNSQLLVGTVTPTSVKQAPGSPYTIAHPISIAVLPKD